MGVSTWRLMRYITPLAIAAAVGVSVSRSSMRFLSPHPYFFKEELVSNDSQLYSFWSKKSEAEGVADLRSLLQQSPYEEAWIYSPSTEEWFEVGSKSHRSKGKSSVRRRGMSMVGWFIQNPGSSLVFYHYHPSRSALTNTVPGGYSTTIQEPNGATEPSAFTLDATLLKSYFKDVPFARPSYGDLSVLTEDSVVAHHLCTNNHLQGKICSEHGVTTYHLTEAGLSNACKGTLTDLLLNPTFQERDKGFSISSDSYMIEFTRHD